MKTALLAEACATWSRASKQVLCRSVRSATSDANAASISAIEFLPLEIPGHTTKRQVSVQKKKREMPAPRSQKIPTDTDWTNVWPAASTFRWSVVPLPVRQGFIDKACENEGVAPVAYANNELLKIPNFLHLTPAHVAKQTRALRRFCTAWPAQLNDDVASAHFPISINTSSYVSSGASLRDPRARSVRIRFRLATLALDQHARDKFIRLIGGYESRMYNRKTDMVTLETDRCPSRTQNYDYLIYAIQVLYSEARKSESWETTERTIDDYATFQFDISRSYRTVSDLLKRTKAHQANEAELMKTPEVTEYRGALGALHDQGETAENISAYKKSVVQLLALDNPSEDTPTTPVHASKD